jgi:hypothetical protein
MMKTKERKIYDLLDRSFDNKQNVIKISKANNLEHELAKFLVCWEFHEIGIDFITEARLTTGHRADILAFTGAGDIIEILHTEKRDNKQKGAYPLPVTKLQAKKVIEKWIQKLS